MTRVTEDEDQDETVEIINISQETMKFQLDAKITMKPGEIRRVHRNYATAQKIKPDRDPVPSTVELLTNKKVLPVTDKRAKPFYDQAKKKA